MGCYGPDGLFFTLKFTLSSISTSSLTYLVVDPAPVDSFTDRVVAIELDGHMLDISCVVIKGYRCCPDFSTINVNIRPQRFSCQLYEPIVNSAPRDEGYYHHKE